MTEKLNNSFFATPGVVTSIPRKAICKRTSRFVMLDLVLLSALGFFWMIMLWSIVNNFFTTFIPSPCLPNVINTAIGVSKVSREYLGIAQAFWSCSNESCHINSLSIPGVVPKLEQTQVSV